VVGLSYLQDGAGWQAQVLRLVDVFLDGLRPWSRGTPDHQPPEAGDRSSE